MPESPRWLISKDRDDEAFQLLTVLHGKGDPQSLLVQAEYQEIRDTLHFERGSTQSFKALVYPSTYS